jgi:hypothetical protein
MLLVMLIKTGEVGLTALRVVTLGLSPTFGRLRLSIGVLGVGESWVVPDEVGIGGIGGRLLSVEGRDELSPIEVAYVVILNRDGGCT